MCPFPQHITVMELQKNIYCRDDVVKRPCFVVLKVACVQYTHFSRQDVIKVKERFEHESVFLSHLSVCLCGFGRSLCLIPTGR